MLVPHPADPEPRSAASKLARQQASQRYVKEAERQLELMMARAGSSQPPLEAVQVLSVAGLYHWAQEGTSATDSTCSVRPGPDCPTAPSILAASVAKMRARQAQALQLAMDLGAPLLHSISSTTSLTFMLRSPPLRRQLDLRARG